jgi:ribosome-binding protein aMBF1 (putative translation factor)
MNTNPSSSLSYRLAELNTRILELETERVELLRLELASAETRSAEVSAFIGVYNASSATVPPTSPAQPSSTRKKTERKSKAQAAPKKASRGKASAEGRLDKAIAIVKRAGTSGISAKQLSEKAGIPYSAVRKILSESGSFRQEGEKRASRIFLK